MFSAYLYHAVRRHPDARVNMNDWSNYDPPLTNRTVAHDHLAAFAGRLRRGGRVGARGGWPQGVRRHLPMCAAPARQWRTLDERDHAELAQKRLLDAAGSRLF